MEVQKYDVLVAGCGPAGSSAAYAAASAGAKVAVFEKEPKVATTVRTSGVTWIKDAISMGIPSHLYNPIRRYAFCSKNNEVIIEGEKPGAAVLDVRGTYRWLAERARDAGAKIMTGTVVSGASRLADGTICMRVTDSVGSASYTCGVAVDASGFASVLASRLGGVKRWTKFGSGAEYEAHAEHVDIDTWWLMVGSEYTPSGYAWIFPVSSDTIRIGVGVGKPDWPEDPKRLLDKIIKDKTGPVASLGKITPIEYHSGVIPNDGTVRRTAYDGLLMVGDSAGQANPLVLEGIRYAIRYGQIAGTIAADAAISGDVSASALYSYESKWRAETDSKIRSAFRIQRRWLKFSDKEWDAELESIRTLNDTELVQFMKADFGSRYATKMTLRHPLFTLRQMYRMMKRY
ncbi:MAG: geranylgeranyl reductase [Cenarchaeum symbiont of Oopsacas minuta]|nr:geranylgeranyl reductase [Cenarchaeum symbiont of Oopsacas minuta]